MAEVRTEAFGHAKSAINIITVLMISELPLITIVRCKRKYVGSFHRNLHAVRYCRRSPWRLEHSIIEPLHDVSPDSMIAALKDNMQEFKPLLFYF